MFIAKDISKKFDGKMVLHGVDLTITPGQITALIGPNGCGKSTLLRALSLLDPPDAGSIALDNMSYMFPLKSGNGIDPPWPNLTMIFQQLFLWPHLTVRQNIALPLKTRGNSKMRDKVKEMIDFFDLSEFADRFPNQISLGQRQRVAIARALALEPKYLLLDEITSALDVGHVHKILNHIKTLRDQGVSILLVTHYIGFAKQTADQVLFMWDGTIVESGGPELFSDPTNEQMLNFLSLLETSK